MAIPDTSDMDLLDDDGYPTEEALNAITQWDITNNEEVFELWEFCRLLWSYPDRWDCYREEDDDYGEWFAFSTGGWSCNESVVVALEENIMYNAILWRSSSKGGHYTAYLAPFKSIT